MSDSDGSPFEGFTEAEFRHLPPTQAVDSANLVVFPSDPQGWSPLCELVVFLVFPLPAHERQSRSHLRAPGLADQIRQILRIELHRGRDSCSRSSSRSRSRSSSGGLSDSESYSRFSRSSCSSSHSRRTRSSRSDRYYRSPRRHGRRFHSYRRND